MKVKIIYTQGDKFHPDTGAKSSDPCAVPLIKLRYDPGYADKGELWFSNEIDSIGYQAANARIKKHATGKQSRRSNIQKFNPKTGEQVSDLTRGAVFFSKLTFSSTAAARGELVFLAPGSVGAITHKSAMKAIRKFKKIHGDKEQHDTEDNLQEGPKPGTTYVVDDNGRIIYHDTGLKRAYNRETGEEIPTDNVRKTLLEKKDMACGVSELTFSRKAAEDENKYVFCPADNEDAIAYTTTYRIVTGKKYEPPKRTYVDRDSGELAEKGDMNATRKDIFDAQRSYVDSRTGDECEKEDSFAITKQQFVNKMQYKKRCPKNSHIIKLFRESVIL